MPERVQARELGPRIEHADRPPLRFMGGLDRAISPAASGTFAEMAGSSPATTRMYAVDGSRTSKRRAKGVTPWRASVYPTTVTIWLRPQRCPDQAARGSGRRGLLRRRRGWRSRGTAAIGHELVELGLVLGEAQAFEEAREVLLLLFQAAQGLGAVFVKRVVAAGRRLLLIAAAIAAAGVPPAAPRRAGLPGIAVTLAVVALGVVAVAR